MLKLDTALSGAKRCMRCTKLFLALCTVLTLSACSQSTDDMMASARDYLSKNDINAASIQLKNVLQQDGAIAEARFLLGSVYLAQGDIAGAVRELRRAQDLGYAQVQVAPRLSQAMVLNGDFDRVVQEFADLTLEDPVAQAKVLAHVGDAQIGRGDAAAARDFFESALAVRPDDIHARVGLARSLLFAGDSDHAMSEAEVIIAMDSSNADAHGIRAEVFRLRGQNDEVLNALDAALKADPTAVNYHFALISMLVEQLRIDEAESRLVDMQKVAPGQPPTLYIQAFLDFRNSKLDSAREAVEALLRQSPNHLLGDLLAGNIYLRQGDHLRARLHLERVLARVPGQALARRALAASHLATGNAMQAKEVLQPLLDSGVEDAFAFSLAGQIFLALGEFDQASKYLERVTESNPEDLRARTSLGLAQLGQGAGQAGLAELEAVAAIDDEGQPDVVLILAHLRDGNFESALAAHERLLRKRPNDPQTFNLKGGIMQVSGDRPAARAAFEQALNIDPGFLSAAVNLSRLDIADGLSANARERFNRIIDANPARTEAYLLMVDLMRQTNASPSDIRSLLERGIKANSTDRSLRMALARQLAEMGDLRAALLIAQELSAADPDEPGALGLLSQVQAAMGDRQQAISNLNRLVRLLPQSPGPLILLSDVQRATADMNGAEQSLRRALVLKSDALDVQQRLIGVLVEQQKLEQAMRVVQSAKQQQPDVAIVHAWEGDLLALGEKWSDAVESYHEALSRGGSVDIVIKLHRSLLLSDRPEEAKNVEVAWFERNPNDVAMHVYLAERAIAEHNHKVAEEHYRRILPMQPDNPMVLNNLAWVAGKLGRGDALVLALRALEQAPQSAAILDTVGMLQIKAGQHPEGLANLKRAVELSPETPLLRLNLAKAYLDLGRSDEAATELDEVLRLAPEGSSLALEATQLRTQD